MTTRRDTERLRKTMAIILTGPRDRRHSTSCKATWENAKMVRRQEARAGEALRPQPLLGFRGKGKTGQGKHLRTGSCKNFSGL